MKRLDGAVNRTTRSGKVIGAGQKIGVEEAIRAYTIGGAYTTHEENRKGSILPGQLADLVILDQDPTTIDPATLPAVRIKATIVGGQLAYTRP